MTKLVASLNFDLLRLGSDDLWYPSVVRDSPCRAYTSFAITGLWCAKFAANRVVKLDNGWVIEFQEYDYFYEFHTDIVIFARQVKAIFVYKVVIEGGDDVYDVTRLR